MFAIRAEHATHPSLRVIIHTHNRTEIAGTGAQQVQTVCLIFRACMLMAQNHVLLPRLQAHPCQQAGASMRLTVMSEALLIEVIRRFRVLLQDTLVTPLRVDGGGTSIDIIEAVIALILLAQF